jgi:putative phosphonoacetaldehyde dehydrogenase
MTLDIDAPRIGNIAAFPRAIEVRNPWSGESVGSVPRASADDVRRAVDVTCGHRPTLSRHARAEILERTAALLGERLGEAATLITRESGLCWKDTHHEIGRVRDVLRFAAMEALRDDGEAYSCDVTPHGRNRRVFTRREPLPGVIAAITPFNHPMNQVAHKVAPAIASNNRVVLKPSEKTPLSALYFAALLHEAGLPRGMLQVVTGDPAEVVTTLLDDARVEMVTFTGGVEAGKSIAARAGYRRMVLELGGNDPLIVMEDADLDEAAELAAKGSYANSGQRCTAVKRILVHASVAEAFIERLVSKTLEWTCGDPCDPTMHMGTVIDEAAAKRIERRVDDALARGARLLAGHQRRGALYPPTVVDGVDPGMELVRQETFGPVSPVMRFASIDEAIALANGTDYGLSSAVCTNRLDYITRFVNELRVGTVNVREVPGFRLELTPFGGVKDSGLGYKEGVREAVKSFTHVKTFSLPWDPA